MDVEKVLQWRQRADGLNKLLDMRVVSIKEGSAVAEVTAGADIANPIGNVHGGAIYTLCDMAAGSAAASRGRIAVTLAGNINYLSPGRMGQVLRAEATEVKHGKQTAVYYVEVTDGEGRKVASSTFTMFYTGQMLEDIL